MLKDVETLTQRDLKRRIARTYLIAIGAIAVVLTCFFMYTQLSVAKSERYPELINIAGKQRMLSQRMGYLQTLILSDSSNQNVRVLQAKLDQANTDFVRHHDILTGKVPFNSETVSLPPELKKLYFDGLNPLDRASRRFYQRSTDIAALSASQLASVPPPAFSRADNLLARLDRAVALFEEQLENDMVQKRWLATIVYLTLLIALVSLILFLFRPLEKLVVSQFKKANDEKESAQLQKATAERANQIKAHYLSRMSHEFRTPISSVIGALELIPNMRSRQDELLQKAEQSCYKLLHLTNNLLDILSINSEPGPSDDGVFDLIRMLDECVAPMSFNCRDRNLDFSMQCSTLPQYVYGAPTEISKALTNILDNAVKFTQKGFISVTIDVKIEDKKYLLCIKVTDTGIGIEKDMQERIFERFVQIDNSINRQFTGAGVGLTIARRHIKNIGGKLELVSQPDVGSEFTLTIPLLPAQHQPAAAQPAERGNFAVVDDLAISRLYLSNLIKSQGYQVETFSSGSELLARGSDILNFNGLIIDYLMPGINGLELGSTLHAMHGDKSPPILMLSATPDVSNVVANSSLAPWQVFLKPVDKNRFTDSLHQLASPRRQGSPVTQGASILVVEDEPINAEIIGHMLENLGYRVVVVTDGESALHQCEDKKFDAILMDINLPGISGIEATKLLSERKYPAPVIAVTANAFESDKAASAQVGIRYHLVKPVSYQELKNTLKLALLKASNTG